jgi:hypothetical protein
MLVLLFNNDNAQRPLLSTLPNFKLAAPLDPHNLLIHTPFCLPLSSKNSSSHQYSGRMLRGENIYRLAGLHVSYRAFTCVQASGVMCCR